MALPPILVELKANSREFVTGMKEAQHEVQKLGTQSAGHMQKFAAVGKAALFGVAAVAGTVAAGSLEMADKFETSHAKLEAALKGAGTSMEAWKGRVASSDKQLEHLGFTNADTESALGGLVIALKDPAKAMQVMGTAADLARAKNLSLADAGVLVAKAMEGQTRPLKALGIDLPINAKNAESLKVAQENVRLATETYNAQLIRLHEKHTVTAADEAALKVSKDRLEFAQKQVNEAHHAGAMVLDELNKRLGGQSQQYAETFAGKVTVLKTQMEDLGVKIGLALIPMLEKAATITSHVVNWFEKHTAVAKILGIAIGSVLVVAIGAFVASMVTATATIGATEIALAPITLALVILGVGIYELGKHWSTVWRDIKAATGDAIGFLVQGFKFMADLALGAFGMVIHGAADAFGWVPGVGGKLKHAAAAFDDFKQSVDAKLTGIANDAYGWGSQVGQQLDNGIIGGLTAKQKEVYSAATGIGTAALTGVRSTARIASPSKVTHYYGQMIGQGFADGILSHRSTVANAAASLVGAVTGGDAGMVGLSPQGPNGSRAASSSGGDIHVHLEGNFYGVDSPRFAVDIRNALLSLRRSSGQSLGFT